MLTLKANLLSKCGSKGIVAAQIVTIRHEASNSEIFDSQYVHLSRIDVAVGQRVSAGEQIGLSGDSGCAYGAHLYFSVMKITPDGERVVADPFGWKGESQDLHRGGRQQMAMEKRSGP